MSKPVFEKGTLYLNQADDDIYFSFPNFMTKDNGKNIMTLSFKPEDLELINKTFPFVPEIGVLFPNFGPADRFPIPNGLETQRLTFDAKIDYKSNLDDLFGGSK
jgi:hypothetical protein